MFWILIVIAFYFSNINTHVVGLLQLIFQLLFFPHLGERVFPSRGNDSPSSFVLAVAVGATAVFNLTVEVAAEMEVCVCAVS